MLPSLIWLVPGAHFIYCFLYWLVAMEGSTNTSKEFIIRGIIGGFLALVAILFGPLWIWDSFGRDWDEKADRWDYDNDKRRKKKPSSF